MGVQSTTHSSWLKSYNTVPDQQVLLGVYALVVPLANDWFLINKQWW